ncbi:cytochrome o ubiquinol oxidase subunit IV [Paenibacillus urinalis]|uniref:Cytochrome o ubiquinol oxidase subunit IV n=3 Tax=Paenibacillus TaxID=44249 RepID=A0AAX3MWR3_9BACL|nr:MULTISPECIES: cytochrome o ubiquinol oxidase subunit IV [Paenibacillus]MCM3130432.1 cytochrome o ubiquinol oxidase subunit IV [Paenibacillus sp. MER 78]OMC64042.1 cytochrome o ubiquinol oxidase subunit IV [Paenibacillus sp. FSL H7-0326]WDH82060.1 cytochrome o ubiquinol oxidase subunit IV [Paenibacillus urinalis]WDH98115.1 cytochrome o ubiquinol oxidase subunit IV [Paenibacillus urinalis]WDI01798.1 cytochrome o ubiquinol oxidase subunit IV [Paenibacillus urinalis]
MAEQHNHAHESHEEHGSLKSYTIGYVISIILTIIPLVVVLNDMFSRTVNMVIILIMAVLQFGVQLLFFMHIRDGEAGKPKWNVMGLILGILLVLTIVVGSIWIMMNNQVAH